MSRSFFALIALYRNDCHLLNVYDPPHCFLWFALSRKCKIYIYIYNYYEWGFFCSSIYRFLNAGSCISAPWTLFLMLSSPLYTRKGCMKYIVGADWVHVQTFPGNKLLRGGGPSKLILPIKCRGQKFPLAKLSLRRPCKTWGMAIRWWRFGASKLPQGPDNVLSTLLWISYKLYQSPA